MTERDFDLEPSLDFLQRVWALAHSLERLSKDMERRLSITAQQRLVLRCLGTYPGVTAGQLAKLLHLDPGTISTRLRRLSQKRLVERHVDSRDRRRVLLGLSTRGRALVSVDDGTAERAVERLIATAGEDAVAHTKKTLTLLARLVDDERNR
ncbi:N/A [soil metagenome]